MAATATTPIRQLRYDSATRQFTAEVSETTGFNGQRLVVQGAHSRVTFNVRSVDRDADRDIRSWLLVSVDGQYSLVLFND